MRGLLLAAILLAPLALAACSGNQGLADASSPPATGSKVVVPPAADPRVGPPGDTALSC